MAGYHCGGGFFRAAYSGETLFIKSIPTSPNSTSTSSSPSSVISSKSRMNHQSSSSTTIVTNFKQTLIDSILVLEYNELNIEYWKLWIRQWWKNYSETEIDATKQERSPRTWEQMQRLHTKEPWIKRKGRNVCYVIELLKRIPEEKYCNPAICRILITSCNYQCYDTMAHLRLKDQSGVF